MASAETALLLLAGSLTGSDSGLRSALQLTSKRLYVYFIGARFLAPGHDLLGSVSEQRT